MNAIFWKEMADHFGRRRFGLLFGLILIGVIWGTFIMTQEVKGSSQDPDAFFFLEVFTTQSNRLPNLLFFISFFGPLISIALGFDSINSERSQGTLSRVLAQPVYRDSLFTGKFLAGLTTLVLIMLTLITSILGLSMFSMGIAPRGEEVVRLLGFGFVTSAYLGFWLALAMTCSTFLRNTVTSALVSLGTWLFLTFFLALFIVPNLASFFAPVNEFSTYQGVIRNANMEIWLSRLSPPMLFAEATTILLNPLQAAVSGTSMIYADLYRSAGVLLQNPISASQSLQLVWPHIIALISLVAVFLAASFIKFMREEIRS